MYSSIYQGWHSWTPRPSRSRFNWSTKEPEGASLSGRCTLAFCRPMLWMHSCVHKQYGLLCSLNYIKPEWQERNKNGSCIKETKLTTCLLTHTMCTFFFACQSALLADQMFNTAQSLPWFQKNEYSWIGQPVWTHTHKNCRETERATTNLNIRMKSSRRGASTGAR